MGIRAGHLAGSPGWPRVLAFLAVAGPGDLLWSMRVGSDHTDAPYDASLTFDGYAALAPCGNEDVTAVGWYRYSADDYDDIADTWRR